MAELIGGSGYDDVQNTAPTSPSIGDTWLDTSGGEATGKIYADLGNGADWQILPVQNELQSGRTRELLMLLQDKPVPEVQDPLNIQSALSQKYRSDGDGDYQIAGPEIIDGFEDGDLVTQNENWGDWNTENGAGLSVEENSLLVGNWSAKHAVNDNTNQANIFKTSGSFTETYFECRLLIDSTTSSTGYYWSYALQGGGSKGIDIRFQHGDQSIMAGDLNSRVNVGSWNKNTHYRIIVRNVDYGNNEHDLEIINVDTDTTIVNETNLKFWNGISEIDEVFLDHDLYNSGESVNAFVDGFKTGPRKTAGYVTDRFEAPTTAPTDFKQWNAIQARDVTTGGSTSANPVAFDLLKGGESLSRSTDTTTTNVTGKYGLVINPNETIDYLSADISEQTSGATKAYIDDTSGNNIATSDVVSGTFEFEGVTLSQGVKYYVRVDNEGSGHTIGYNASLSLPINGTPFDIVAGVSSTEKNDRVFAINNITNIRKYTNTRIPTTQIADQSFTMRNRLYSEDAGSDGQSDYTIATTGDGGHFGIPVLTVVSVKKNGSVLDSANWSFDGTDTVTIDTSNVTIASGDTIDIKYDFDVFDSTLQPRAYLSRASTSETSPSISHFRYEYVI